MKRIKEFLDFLVSLVTTWKIIFPIIVIVLAAFLKIFKFATEIYTLSLPLWAFIVISILAFYPIANFIKFIFTRRKVPYTNLYGLLWKPPFFSFNYPKPICPKKDCRREVICKTIMPRQLQLLTNLSDWENADFSNHFIYECPIHGQLNGVPDEPINCLTEKAKLALKKLI